MDRWQRAVDQARAAALAGVVEQYLSNDPRFAPTTVYPPFPRTEGPNPVEATVLVKTR